jgi:nicotinamidase-related amidase
MAPPTLPPIAKTAILLIDPYNDFIHPDGKLYGLLEESLKSSDTISHIFTLLAAARKNKIPVYYGLHQPYKPGNFEGWKHKKVVHTSQEESKAFEEGSWGGTIFEGMEPDAGNGDVVVSKHWSSS